jgi:TonB family protein
MTTSSSTAFAEARRQTWMGRLAAVAVLAALAIAVWLAATYHTTVLKKEAPVSMLMPVQAPPPPPPPPKELQPQATTTPLDQPITPQPQAAKDNAITENAEAQIGGDAYGIGSGSGEGTHGSGVAGMFDRGPYASYMAQVIRSAASRNAILKGKIFHVGIRLWLSPAGKVTRAELTSSTGSDEFDRELKSVLASLSFDQAPPQSILDSLPIEMAVKVHPG